MKKIVLFLLEICMCALLFAGERQVAAALSGKGKYYYCSRDNTVYHVIYKDKKVSFSEYKICNGRLGSSLSWSENLIPSRYEMNGKKVVSIVCKNTRIILTDIKDASQVGDFLTEEIYKKIQSVCGIYYNEDKDRTITLSDADGKINLKVVKEDGSINEDTFEEMDSKKISGKNGYYLFFDYGYMKIRNEMESLYEEMSYKDDYCFRFDYEEVGSYDKPDKIIASSVLIEENKEKGFYGENNLVDGTWKSWVEGVEGDGIGESITFKFDSPIEIKGIGIRNGYGDLRFYFANNRVKKFGVYVNGEYKSDYDLADTFELQKDDKLRYENVSSITLKIKEVYKGCKYDDTCVSEVYFFNEFYPVLGNFTEDDYTKKALSAFPVYSKRYDTFLYTSSGSPIMIHPVDPPSRHDIWCFKDIEFYIYKNGEWKLDNANPIFREVRKEIDAARKNNHRLNFGLEKYREQYCYELDDMDLKDDEYEYDYDGVSFKTHVHKWSSGK